VAFFVDMGRDLRARYDPAWDLERNQRPIILCETHAKPPASADRYGIECSWRSWGSSWSRSDRAITAPETTPRPSLRLTLGYSLYSYSSNYGRTALKACVANHVTMHAFFLCFVRRDVSSPSPSMSVSDVKSGSSCTRRCTS
jgi:hypothetical protein